MKKYLILLSCFFLLGAAPSRQHVYTTGTTISSSDVTENEDAIFTYLQDGVDTYENDSIVDADINSAANIQSDKINLESIASTVRFTTGGVMGLPKGTSAPATCTAGDLFFDTDAIEGNGINVCTATNTWRYPSTIKVIASPSADHSASGTLITLTAGDTVGFGDACYINPANGQAKLADADGLATATAVVVAIGAISASASGDFLMHGIARDDTWNWTTGQVVYLSTTGTTGNTLTATAPSGADDVITIIGQATDPDRMLVNPNMVQVVHQ